MSFFFNTRETKAVDPAKASLGAPTGFFENLSASFDETTAADLLNSEGLMIREARDERRKLIEGLTNKSFDEAIAPFRGAEEEPSELSFEGPHEVEDRAVEGLRATLPEDAQGQVLSAKQLDGRAREIALDKVARAADVRARGQGFGALAGSFAGAAGALVQDPVIAATLPLGASSGARLLVASGIEAAVAGGSEIAVSPVVQKWRKRLGLESGVGVALENAGTAAAVGAASVPALRGLGLLARPLLRGAGTPGIRLGEISDRDMLKAYDDLVPEPTPEQRSARDQLEAEVDMAEAEPFDGSPQGQEEHATRASETQRSLEEDGRAADLDDVPEDLVPEPRPAIAEAAARAAPGTPFMHFDPDELLIDAKRFQFKEGGNEQGVTDRLEGVTQWDPVRAGVVLVYEDASGRRFVADGHQRHGLAKRVKSADPAQRPLLTGYVFREADGITVEKMRGIAAAKNIAEGTGSAIDAAKILRNTPEIGLDLPPRSALVRDASGLARLADDAFSMVVNDRVPPNYAALTGRLAPDQPDTHAQVLKVLIDTKPANLVEAESITRDVLSAPQVRETQTNLFGSEETAQILYGERAKVLGSAAARIRKDRAAFNTLVREEARITETGANVLDTDANLTRAEDDAKILETIQKLSRRKGPVADALARAAKDLKGGASLNRVVGRFIEDVRRGGAGDGANRGVDGKRGRVGERGDDGGGDGGGSGQGGAGPAARSGAEQSAGARSLDDRLTPPERNSAPLPDNHFDGFDDAAGDALTREADVLEGDLRRAIEAGDDIDVPGEQGSVKASKILSDIEADRDFLEQLEVCGR